MVIGALSLLGLFAFPLWRITLEAPQYPDGVTLYIYINKLGGDSPGTLQNVNILNHYIGMQYIEPDSIPELKYFPYIVIGLVVLGLLVAIPNRRWLFFSWVTLLLLLGAAGIYDFYLWEYDYGHNLSPNAPIKIPEASFQPPLIGRKVILNFVAISMPHIGAIFVGLAAFFGLAAWWLKGRRPGKGRAVRGEGESSISAESRKATAAGQRRTTYAAPVTGVLAALFLSGCTPEPTPISYGEDSCDFCRMTIVDPQHAAEVVTNKGRVYKFDAIECMVSHVKREGEEQFSFILVNDYADPGELIDAGKARFLISEAIPSPMGAFLSAFEERQTADEFLAEKGGTLYSWRSLQAHFDTAGLSFN